MPSTTLSELPFPTSLFTMLNKIRKIVLPLIFWFLIWHVLSLIVDNSFMLPGIKKTFSALMTLITQKTFLKAVISSTVRVILGLALGCTFGIILAILCKKISLFYDIFAPIITVIRSTPVASFIVILWLLLDGNTLTVAIGFIMVLPIIWQSTVDGISSIDESLLEVSRIFEFSVVKKFRLLILPAMKNFLFPAIITSTGLAWKAEIAAEIIAYTKNSIGQGINDAKIFMDTPTVFAWTLVVIFFSIILESLTKFLLRRSKNGT